MFTTRKWWLLLVAALVSLSPSLAWADGMYSQNFTVAAAGPAINNIGTAIAFHQLTWTVVGTASVCTVALDTSADGITWSAGGAITGQTCTSNGTSTVTNHIVNYVRINVTALTVTAGSRVNIVWNGYINMPGSGGGVSSCSTTGGVAYENGTSNTLTCGVNEIINNSGRQELAIGKGVTNLVDAGAAGISITNASGPSNSFVIDEMQDANGSWANSIVQAGRHAGGLTMQGSAGTVPGALEVGVFGIIDTSAITELLFTPDGGTILYGPTDGNLLTFNNNLNPASGGFIGSNDTNQIFFQAAGDGVSHSVETDYHYGTGIWDLLTGAGVKALEINASQNAIFSQNASATSLSCGVLNTTACVLTGFGGTSGSATITWPAVAGTIANPLVFSNAIRQNQAGIGTTPTDSFELFNATAAGAGAQQYSPSIHWQGQGWKTNATAGSQTVDFIAYVMPVQGAANPSANLQFAYQVNGSGYTNGCTMSTSASLVCGFLGTSQVFNSTTGAALYTTTAPTVAASGCGTTGASIVSNNGTGAFKVNVGTTNSGTCTITLPAATTDWICSATDITTTSTTVSQTKSVPKIGSLTTQITLQNYTDISGTHAWVDSDVIAVSCMGE